MENKIKKIIAKTFKCKISDINENLVELKDIKKISNFTSDGFHLNKKGQLLLFEKLNKIILNDDKK